MAAPVTRTETTYPATESVEYAAQVGARVGRWAESRRQPLVVLCLIFSDIVLALTVWQVAATVQRLFGSGSLSDISVAIVVPYIAAWVGLRASLGLYPGYGLGQVEELRRQTLALAAALSITIVFAFASQVGDLLSRLLIFAWSLSLLVLAPMARHLVKQAMAKLGLWGKPVLVLGARGTGVQVLRVLQREWQLGLRPVGVFDNIQAPVDGQLEGVPYGGTLTDAVALGKEHGIDTAILAMPYAPHLTRFASLVSNSFQHVIVIPNLDGITNSAVVARDLAGIFGVEVKYSLLNPWAQRLKRMLDLSATLIGGLFAAPLIGFLALLVWAESRGPVFYADRRMGRDGKLFSCVKFRTMVPDAEELLRRLLEEDGELREEYEKYHKLRDDPRITKVGRLLRKTSLDELPQLWNVLKGEMSLVGPRPYLPRESADIGATQSEILRVLPGITGPWQVAGRNHLSFGERVQMDARYVHDWSVWLDITLLARTARTLLFSRNAY